MTTPISLAHPARFLPAFVGSKTRWIAQPSVADALSGRTVVEMFAGSAALSAAFASTSLLVDIDPMLARILRRFDEQIVPQEAFTRADFFKVRRREDWWRYAYCLQAMSFSGVFRYSGNGYNVSHRGGGRSAADPSTAPAYDALALRRGYEAALTRWRDMSPTVVTGSYLAITPEQIDECGDDPVVVLDPPYEGSQAAYNTAFDYSSYWRRVDELRERFDLVVFDRASNLQRAGFPVAATRAMRVNGARPGDIEAVSVLHRRR